MSIAILPTSCPAAIYKTAMAYRKLGSRNKKNAYGREIRAKRLRLQKKGRG